MSNPSNPTNSNPSHESFYGRLYDLIHDFNSCIEVGSEGEIQLKKKSLMKRLMSSPLSPTRRLGGSPIRRLSGNTSIFGNSNLPCSNSPRSPRRRASHPALVSPPSLRRSLNAAYKRQSMVMEASGFGVRNVKSADVKGSEADVKMQGLPNRVQSMRDGRFRSLQVSVEPLSRDALKAPDDSAKEAAVVRAAEPASSAPLSPDLARWLSSNGNELAPSESKSKLTSPQSKSPRPPPLQRMTSVSKLLKLSPLKKLRRLKRTKSGNVNDEMTDFISRVEENGDVFRRIGYHDLFDPESSLEEKEEAIEKEVFWKNKVNAALIHLSATYKAVMAARYDTEESENTFVENFKKENFDRPSSDLATFEQNQRKYYTFPNSTPVNRQLPNIKQFRTIS